MGRGRKKALGRGLGGLLDDGMQALLSHPEGEAPDAVAELPADLLYVPVKLLSPNPQQPRRTFDPQAMADLVDSIANNGVLQPILAMRHPDVEGEYILLAGERRWRAAQEAGLEHIPARVIQADPQQVLELAIIENVQRENLNAVEEAEGYRALMDQFDYTQEEVSERVGKSRASVANALRLLKLPGPILASVEEGEISAGHARAILSLHHPAQQEILRQAIVEGGLNVRQAEDLAKRIASGEMDRAAEESAPKPASSGKAKRKQDLDVVHLEEQLLLRLGCPVRFRARTKASGTITIQYRSLDDLDRVLEALKVSPDT